MKAFMYLTQAIRDVLIVVLCLITLVIGAAVNWLMDESTLTNVKERHND